MKTAIVILSGGSGTRLWPLSRNNFPKQFSSFVDKKSLLRNTYERIQGIYNNEDIFISANTQYFDWIRNEIPEINKENYILEPKRMDRTAAFGLINLILKDRGYHTVMLFACDDYIGNIEEFQRVLKVCEEFNQKSPENLLVIGMNPSFASTGFGYIEMGEPKDRCGKDIIFTVQSFKEKPDKKTAEKFIADWRYLWNAGWFIFNPETLVKKYEQLVPETHKNLLNCYKLDPFTDEFLEEFSKCEKVTFDISIIEKSNDVVVLPASVGWSDIGSWKAVKEIHTGVEDNVRNAVIAQNNIVMDTKGSLIYSTNKEKLIAVLGMEDVVVVDTEDVLLVVPVDKCQDVKKLVEAAPEELK